MNDTNKNLSPQKQADLETLKVLQNAKFTLLQIKSSLLPTIASLAATLLVVATFNEELVPLTEGVKYALVILLFLIPISLFTSLKEIFDGLKVENEEEARILGKEPNQASGTFLKSLLRDPTGIQTIVLTVVILYIIYLIIPCY